MMSLRGSYPHPVLDASDDINSTFEVFNLSYFPAVEDIEVKFQVRMNDPTLRKLIDAGDARLIFTWTCSSTLTSGELVSCAEQAYADSTGYTAFIDQRNARGMVRLNFRIIAVSFLPEYRPNLIHEDYGDAVFEVQPGAVLADAGEAEFSPEKLFDPLNPPVASCFRFVSEPRIQRMLVKFDEDDAVIVSFPESAFSGLSALAHKPELQIGLAVLPALAETLHFIQSQERDEQTEELVDKIWYQAIKTLMVKHGLTFENPPIEIAQRLLGNPIIKALDVAEGEDHD